MEEELKLLNKEIEGVFFWELIRFKVHRDILQEKNIIKSGHEKPKNNYINKLRSFNKTIGWIFLKNPFLSKEVDLLFWGHPRRKKSDGGFFWDNHTDPIINSLKNEFRCLLLEPTYLGAHFIPPVTTNIRYTDFIQLLIFIFKKRIDFVDNSKLISQIESEIYSRFEVKINIKKILVKKLSTKKISVNIYILLLKRLKPKLVFIIVSYGNEFFIEACKTLNITVIELQHGGGVSWHHLGYSYPNLSKILFPDYFFTFGEFWKRRLKYPIPMKKVIPVGCAFHEIEKEKYLNENKLNQIIIVSQGNVGNEICKFAIDLQNDATFDYKIIYKLHPGEYLNWENKYADLITAGITVVSDDSIPLYRLLAQSKVVIGVSSTVLYESLGFNVNIFLLNLPGMEYMQELIDEDIANVVSTSSEFLNKYNSLNPNKLNSDYFYKKNALENIKMEITRLI
tara:strand:+ start:90992 stop:92347 length:1356 start_codon:yes stop_codon:yes gene_type:complete